MGILLNEYDNIVFGSVTTVDGTCHFLGETLEAFIEKIAARMNAGPNSNIVPASNLV